jgi:hypothetical protein
VTKKRSTRVRYRFESGREETFELAEVIYRELRAFAAILADPRASAKVRAHAEAQLRDAAEKQAEVTLRRAKLPRKASDEQVDAALAKPGTTQETAADALQMSDRQLRNRLRAKRNRKP